MGNEVSQVEYEGPPEVLEGRDIPSLAKYIKSDKCKNVFLMVSACYSSQMLCTAHMQLPSSVPVRTRQRNVSELYIELLYLGVSTSAGIPDFRSPETGKSPIYKYSACFSLCFPNRSLRMSHSRLRMR